MSSTADPDGNGGADGKGGRSYLSSLFLFFDWATAHWALFATSVRATNPSDELTQ